MRILVVGDRAVEAAAASVFGGRNDVTFQAVKTAGELSKRLDDGESSLVFLHGGEDRLEGLPEALQRGALVVVVADAESASVRSFALSAGARDVLFAPVDGPALQACAESVLGVPGRRHPRFETESPVSLVPVTVAVIAAGERREAIAAAPALEGKLRNLSAGGFRADLPKEVARGALVSLVVASDPAPPALPARVLACEPAEPAGTRVHARFVGLTRDERTALDRLIDRLRR